MKTAILKVISDRVKILNRLSIIAETLPETGPVPWMIDDKEGAFHFMGAHQVERVEAAFGRRDWRRIGTKGGVINRVKRLPSGVTIIVENAEPVVMIDEPIEVPSLS